MNELQLCLWMINNDQHLLISMQKKALSVLKYLTYKWVSIVGGRERLGPGLNSRVLNQKSKSVGQPRSLHSQQKAEAASPVARAAADLRVHYVPGC